MILFKERFKKHLFSNFLFVLSLFYAFFGLGVERPFRPLFVVFFILVLAYTITYQRELFKTPPIYIFFLAISVGMVTWLLTSLQIPEIATRSPRLMSIINKFSFIPLAVVLAGSNKRTFLFWGVAALASILSPWLAGDGFKEVYQAAHGLRTGFGGHIITMGIIYSIIIFGALVFCRRFAFAPFSKKWFFAFLFLLLSASFGVWASETRAVYLGLGTVGFLTYLTVLFFSIRNWERHRKTFFYSTLSLLVLFLVIFNVYKLGGFDFILNKINREESVFWLLLSGDINNIPRNSAGLRIHFWANAFYNYIPYRPWFGWGGGANEYLHMMAGDWFGDRYFVTMHNDTVELLLGYGVMGLAAFLCLIVWFILNILKLYKTNKIDVDLLVFFIGFLVIFAINGVFMSILFFDDTIFLWNVVLAGFLGYIFKFSSLEKDNV